MEIPKEIKDCIRECARAFQTAREHEKVVRDWLENSNIKLFMRGCCFIEIVELEGLANGII